MKRLSCLLLASALLGGAAETTSPRPLIWVTAVDRAPILAKIESQAWARASFAAMQARVDEAVAQHGRDPGGFLRGLPLVVDPANPLRPPTLVRVRRSLEHDSAEERRNTLQRYLLLGEDCGVLSFLTGDARYARCAADILGTVVEALVQMTPNEAVENGGLVYPDDHLYEARVVGAQVPIIYDFVHGHLRAGATVHDLATGGRRTFNFEHAQQVFRTYARLAIEHGLNDCNWPVLEMPSLVHNALAIDDPAERTRLLAYVTHRDTPHQDSLRKVVAEYAKPGAVWPESLQYSGGVSSLATYLVALLRRQDPPLPLPDSYANIPLSLARLRDFRFPNGENIRFGDGPRLSGDAWDSYEIAYALGRREGDARLQQIFGGLIRLGIQQGRYDRAVPRANNTGASANLGPLQLLWYAPEVSGEAATAAAPRVTDALPFVGAVLQRNLGPAADPAHALMAVVSGGHHVHGHASGMALELYGAGQVLGANAGKGTYKTDEHENYRRLFAAYNSVIVNGASRSAGGWVNLGINTVEQVALEPAVGAAPVSPRHSFALTRFADDRGDGAQATQERLVGLVRTSPATGYYVDVFRSRSARPGQFHDYLYHNIGDTMRLATARGPLPLADAPGRFGPVAGARWQQNRAYLFPGWHVFKQARVSASLAEDVTVEFAAPRLRPAPAQMRLFIPGAEGREYAQALAPATKEAPEPYGRAPTPVLVIRQPGEAWDRPFAVIYEPRAGAADSGAVQAVTALRQDGAFAGFKVMSRVEGRSSIQYVLVPPAATGAFDDARLGLSLRGRYAVIEVDERGACTALYLGEGTRLRFREHELSSGSGRAVAAAVELNAAGPLLSANAPVELALPNGTRLRGGDARSLP